MTHPGLDLQALSRYLKVEGIDTVGELRATPIAGGRSNLTYVVRDEASTWVFRRPPIAGLTPSAHAVDREYRAMAALDRTGVPVPRTVALCMDEDVMGAKFTLVEYVEGRTLSTQADLDAYSDSDLDRCSDELIRVLAALHSVDPRAVGLDDFGRPGYVERQVRLWHRQWGLVSLAPSGDVDTVHAKLSERIPAERPLAIVHGDYRIDNVMVSPDDVGRIVAVVDWELSTLGDPLCDLAMMCAYRHPAFDHILGAPAASTSPRMTGVEDLAARYAQTSGADIGDWPFYFAFACFKLAVIAEGIRHRSEQGASAGAGFDTAGAAVPELISAASAALAQAA